MRGMSDVRIIPATRDEGLIVAALALQMDLEDDAATPRPGFITEYADAWLADYARRPTWLAFGPEGEAVGLVQAALITKLPSLRRPVVSWLHVGQVFVVRAHRGHGLAGRMLTDVQDWARRHQVDRIQLNARQQARSVYERAGFTPAADRLMEWRP
ncbi:acetyltransferase (GNAT) family protein [Branchiibius hedensis]|uniref:Acetyltransferase (GNAT) family protein n=2 Tax=Branchiibius hedensis TaxID=672460 RepID=A0A2Y8ZV59_9MICO|nr:acetyltransferase (GNAT) family protein [Branchiibius hedensis]SSA33777.1 Acetyltransferase (GNAT) family protein [Branchiibius hedensis]